MSDELHDRLNRTLGDLPEDVTGEELYGLYARRRRQIPLPGMGGPAVGVPLAPARPAGRPTGLAVPQLEALVQSVYDARPINARDFTAGFVAQEVGLGGTFVRVAYRVPLQNVAVIRSISWAQIQFNLFPMSESLLLASDIDIFFDDVPQQIFDTRQPSQYTPPPLLAVQGPVLLPLSVNDYPVFLIAGPGVLVELRWTTTITTAQSNRAEGSFRGNLLQSHGLPANFEIGTVG